MFFRTKATCDMTANNCSDRNGHRNIWRICHWRLQLIVYPRRLAELVLWGWSVRFEPQMSSYLRRDYLVRKCVRNGSFDGHTWQMLENNRTMCIHLAQAAGASSFPDVNEIICLFCWVRVSVREHCDRTKIWQKTSKVHNTLIQLSDILSQQR